MERNYETLSLETHLFFGRIMKEHAFFLMAGFPAKNAEYIQRADWYRMRFENLLRDTVRLAENGIGEAVLRSDEIVTDYTLGAERRTSFLTGIPIDSRITEAERNLRSSCRWRESSRRERAVRELNRRSLRLLAGLINFKMRILNDVDVCRLFTFNYALLIEHILREARMYRSLIVELEETGDLSEENMWEMESFWNRIMMEHALFIRGLLDPSEETLIQTADEFAEEYQKLLDEARQKDGMTWKDRTEKTIEETLRYRDFKAAGTKGIIDCEIKGLILPLLADHVLREANHYLRLLGDNCKCSMND